MFLLVCSPKCIGICQKRAVGVNCEGKKIVLSIKSTKNAAKPSKLVHNANVKSAKSVSKEVIDCLKDSFYRLLRAAIVLASRKLLLLVTTLSTWLSAVLVDSMSTRRDLWDVLTKRPLVLQ